MKRTTYLTATTQRWTSLLKKLRTEKRINEQFEIFISSLTLEEIIALKLELSVKTQGSPIYGLPLLQNLNHIVQDAVVKFAVSTTYTSSEAARLLGVTQTNLYPLVKRFSIYQYFGKYAKMYRNWRQAGNTKKETPT